MAETALIIISSETEAMSQVLSILSREFLCELSVTSFNEYFHSITSRFQDIKAQRSQQLAIRFFLSYIYIILLL